MTWVEVISPAGFREFDLRPRPLGRGSFGSVHRASDRMGAEFAVKLVALAADPLTASRQRSAFIAEAAALQRIQHPNVVRYMLHGEIPTGARDDQAALALIMEYVDGATLKDLIGPGGVGAERALDYFSQLCRGLDGIHAVVPPLVHRDIKPANIVIGARDGTLRIVDFGLGRVDGPAGSDSAAVGTPLYMAPEQLLARSVERRSDLYAAALVAYELLTGRVPLVDVQGRPDSRARSVGWKPGLDDLPPELGPFFQRALAGEPDDRPATAEELLSAYRDSQPRALFTKPSRPPTIGRNTEPLIRANRWEDYRDGCIAALEIEIQAVLAELKERGADQPVEVRHGRREDAAPDWSLYAVKSPESLLVAEDTPLRAIIDSRTVRGHVVSCDPEQGLMRLALYDDVGDDFERALVEFDATFILKRLIEQLESTDTKPNTALAIALAQNSGYVGDVPLDRWILGAALNKAQISAVSRALGSSVTYIWGPPGTGKTRTVAHLLAALLGQSGRTAAVAPTNAATDALALAFARIGHDRVRSAIAEGRIVRLGETSPAIRNARIDLDWCFECTARDSYPAVVAAIETLWEDYQGHIGAKSKAKGTERRLLRSRFFQVRHDVARAVSSHRQAGRDASAALAALGPRVAATLPDIDLVDEAALARASLIVTTLSKFHLDRRLGMQSFSTLVVDEASMAPLPAVLFAAAMAQSRVTVAGDFRQLAPVVVSDAPTVTRWLSHDIFEIAGVIDEHSDIPSRPLLNTQYRMHPEIMRIVSDLFYGGRLENGVAGPGLGDGGATDRSVMALLDTTGPLSRSQKPHDRSRVNAAHAELVAAVVDHAVRAGFRDIAVITPYVAQARLIRDSMRQLDADLLRRCRIATVHRFQGQEAPLVIFDTVDAPTIPVGFLNERKNPASLRIINVAISRAQQRLVVIAHADFLGKQLRTQDRLLQVLRAIRTRGQEYSLQFDGLNKVAGWLCTAGGSSAVLAPDEWIRCAGREGVVVSLEGANVRLLADGAEVKVPLESVEAVFRQGQWSSLRV